VSAQAATEGGTSCRLEMALADSRLPQPLNKGTAGTVSFPVMPMQSFHNKCNAQAVRSIIQPAKAKPQGVYNVPATFALKNFRSWKANRGLASDHNPRQATCNAKNARWQSLQGQTGHVAMELSLLMALGRLPRHLRPGKALGGRPYSVSRPSLASGLPGSESTRALLHCQIEFLVISCPSPLRHLELSMAAASPLPLSDGPHSCHMAHMTWPSAGAFRACSALAIGRASPNP
jgi:hypothetical protein